MKSCEHPQLYLNKVDCICDMYYPLHSSCKGSRKARARCDQQGNLWHERAHEVDGSFLRQTNGDSSVILGLLNYRYLPMYHRCNSFGST
jgi:hypothetical protein